MSELGSAPDNLLSDLPPVTILVADDEEANRESLKLIFEREGYEVAEAPNARVALEILRSRRVGVLFTDLMMPGTNGVELLKASKEVSPDTQVILMTAYGTVETAVSAMQEGALDFIEKPLKRASLVRAAKIATERYRLVCENRSLKQEVRALHRREIVGQSASLRKVLDIAAHAAPSTATVLVLGESGTGKELIARYIHEHSKRLGAFVAVNCSAIPETIIEAELFGHERGAFTGAHQKREGRFARARGGTLFLDEIGELSPSVQVKLLRVLQEGEYEPVGGNPQKADVRIIAATNRTLEDEVEAGRFREDLFYRLNVISLTSPPLRHRLEDVPLLCEHFLQLYCQKNQRSPVVIDEVALKRLLDYSWPGNVRELENMMERASVLVRSDKLLESDLPPQVAQAESKPVDTLSFPVGTPVIEMENRMIRETLRHTNGDKNLTAQLLGISVRTIYRKLDGSL